MKQIEQLLADSELISLRQGRSKKNLSLWRDGFRCNSNGEYGNNRS